MLYTALLYTAAVPDLLCKQPQILEEKLSQHGCVMEHSVCVDHVSLWAANLLCCSSFQAVLAEHHSAMQGRFTLFSEQLRPSELLLDLVYASATKSTSAEAPCVCRGNMHLQPQDLLTGTPLTMRCRDPL